jgi:hypothetical protein
MQPCRPNTLRASPAKIAHVLINLVLKLRNICVQRFNGL